MRKVRDLLLWWFDRQEWRFHRTRQRHETVLRGYDPILKPGAVPVAIRDDPALADVRKEYEGLNRELETELLDVLSNHRFKVTLEATGPATATEGWEDSRETAIERAVERAVNVLSAWDEYRYYSSGSELRWQYHLPELSKIFNLSMRVAHLYVQLGSICAIQGDYQSGFELLRRARCRFELQLWPSPGLYSLSQVLYRSGQAHYWQAVETGDQQHVTEAPRCLQSCLALDKKAGRSEDAQTTQQLIGVVKRLSGH